MFKSFLHLLTVPWNEDMKRLLSGVGIQCPTKAYIAGQVNPCNNKTYIIVINEFIIPELSVQYDNFIQIVFVLVVETKFVYLSLKVQQIRARRLQATRNPNTYFNFRHSSLSPSLTLIPRSTPGLIKLLIFFFSCWF